MAPLVAAASTWARRGGRYGEVRRVYVPVVVAHPDRLAGTLGWPGPRIGTVAVQQSSQQGKWATHPPNHPYGWNALIFIM